MLRLRRFALGLGALAATAAALAVPSAMADSWPAGSVVTLTSTHFQIHFDGDHTATDFVPAACANDILGFAERAYTTYTGLGYTPPVHDGDGRIDIYMEKFAGEPLIHYAGFAAPKPPTGTTSAG